LQKALPTYLVVSNLTQPILTTYHFHW